MKEETKNIDVCDFCEAEINKGYGSKYCVFKKTELKQFVGFMDQTADTNQSTAEELEYIEFCLGCLEKMIKAYSESLKK